MRTLNGGWSYTWQGDADKFASQYNTILEALQSVYGKSNVIYEPGVTYDMTGGYNNGKWQRENEPDIRAAVKAARKADVIVACIGENSYCRDSWQSQ